jgi:hypothetical protein
MPRLRYSLPKKCTVLRKGLSTSSEPLLYRLLESQERDNQIKIAGAWSIIIAAARMGFVELCPFSIAHSVHI